MLARKIAAGLSSSHIVTCQPVEPSLRPCSLCKSASLMVGSKTVHASRGARLVTFGMEPDTSFSPGEKAMFGEDFGARDPYAGELESNFGEKVLGNFDTEHVIKIPNKIKNFVGLTSRSCSPEGAQTAVQGEKEMNLLKNQLPGWKVVTGKSGCPTLRFDWRLKNPDSAARLQGMISDLSQAQGHAVSSMEPSGELLFLELCTPAVNGLSENDFILAAKVNELDYKSLEAPPRKKFWA